MNFKSISFYLSLFCFPISFLAFINILYASYFDYFLSFDTYFAALIISLFTGGGLWYYGKNASKNIDFIEQLVLIISAYFLTSILIAIPFYLSNYQVTFLNSIFESVSGFWTPLISESRVLISGPTGSGKELVARKIHKNSTRSKEPFVIINAALLKEKTYEKELFGEEFEDGNISFGALERANKGTLLIDEVSEIPFETQVNVLRVLIDQKFKRMNGSKDINVNIRLISSTSKNLNELVKENKFREDLYHRLNVMPIDLPSLSSRTEDVPLLIDYFKTKLSEINGVQKPDIDMKNVSLYTYNWPGNVRELRNLVLK